MSKKGFYSKYDLFLDKLTKRTLDIKKTSLAIKIKMLFNFIIFSVLLFSLLNFNGFIWLISLLFIFPLVFSFHISFNLNKKLNDKNLITETIYSFSKNKCYISNVLNLGHGFPIDDRELTKDEINEFKTILLEIYPEDEVINKFNFMLKKGHISFYDVVELHSNESYFISEKEKELKEKTTMDIATNIVKNRD